MDSIPSYPTPKERQLAAVPVSLFNHPSKVMLKIILNRLQPHIAEEQAGFRAGRSITEKNIQSLNPLRKVPTASAESLRHVFIDFKKAFDREWHEAFGNYEEIQH